jgi:hypothetical protein
MTTKVFIVSITCDNAAYEGNGLEEHLADNLVQIAEQVAGGLTQGIVRDYNENAVGKYFFVDS